jgi:hypothetical protein
LTPHPPAPLLSDNSSLTNVSITLGANGDQANSNIGNTADIANFVNGTAAGLTCFIHPDTSFVGWPYGGGGFNAVPTTTGGGGAQSSSPAPSPSGSDNGASVDSVTTGTIIWMAVGSLLGVRLIL